MVFLPRYDALAIRRTFFRAWLIRPRFASCMEFYFLAARGKTSPLRQAPRLPEKQTHRDPVGQEFSKPGKPVTPPV